MEFVLSCLFDHMESRENTVIIICPSIRSIGWNLEGRIKEDDSHFLTFGIL